ncbi:MAG TPA: O-antigen ligase family protein [Thermoanaerobaculia bacterium]|nr:O-antigen ligase family protein [Thermoanaerobaculia bacterium]
MHGPLLGELAVWALVLLPPLLVAPSAKESFRLPKLMACEWLGLASLVFLAWRLRGVAEIHGRDLWRLPVLRAVAPLLAVATLGLATTRHPLHLREALADLWIGAACLVGWSLGLSRPQLERLLRGLLWPAAALALLGLLQFHGIYQPLRFFDLAPGGRLAITSTAGNPGDLGAYLVLPCLVAQWALAGRFRGGGRGRWATAAALAIALYALAATQTLSALAALLTGSVLLWGSLLPRRWRLPAAAAGLALAAVLVLAVPPLRARVTEKAGEVAAGDWNSVLTGRLDGWRTAAWMLRQHPLAGVGQGAFRTEFAPAKLALLADGVQFFPRQVESVFVNAHSEILEVAADLGVPGLAALLWGIWMLVSALRRLAGAGEAAASGFALAGTGALAVLALAQFPFRVALTAFPALLFLAWVFRAAESSGEEVPG